MPIDANALTISDYALMSNDPLVMKVTKSLLVNGAVLSDIPLIDKKSLKITGARWTGNLPTVNWAKLNTEPAVTKGVPTPYEEQAYILRNAIDVDVKLLQDENQIVDPRGAMLEAYLQSVSYDMNDKFINNDHTSGNPDAFVGIRARLDNPAVYGTTPELKIDAGGTDMSQAGMTSTTANNFIEYVQQMLDWMGRPEGDGVVLYMNDTLRRRFERAIRVLGTGAGFRMTEDAFDRRISMYKNARVVDIGRKADQTTRIITNTETAAGLPGAGDRTSLYAVAYGQDSFLGWQFESFQNAVKDIGLIGNAGTIMRILIDWAFGIVQVHTRALARIYNIKV